MAPKHDEETMKAKILKKVYSRFKKEGWKNITVVKLFKAIYKIEREIAERNRTDLEYFFEILQKLAGELKLKLDIAPVKSKDPDDIDYELHPCVDRKMQLTETPMTQSLTDYWKVPIEDETLHGVFTQALDLYFSERDFKKAPLKTFFNWLRMPLRKKKTFDDTDLVYFNILKDTVKKLSEEGQYIVSVKKPPKQQDIYTRAKVSLPLTEAFSDDGSYEVKKKREVEEEEEEEERPKKKKKKVEFEEEEEN